MGYFSADKHTTRLKILHNFALIECSNTREYVKHVKKYFCIQPKKLQLALCAYREPSGLADSTGSFRLARGGPPASSILALAGAGLPPIGP